MQHTQLTQHAAGHSSPDPAAASSPAGVAPAAAQCQLDPQPHPQKQLGKPRLHPTTPWLLMGDTLKGLALKQESGGGELQPVVGSHLLKAPVQGHGQGVPGQGLGP